MAADIRINIKAHDAATGVLRGVTNSLKNVFSFAAGDLLARGMASAFNMLTRSFAGATEGARAQRDAEKQLAAVLKSTGGAAGLTADQITSHASALQRLTNYTDDQILSGSNLLLTFTNIGSETFPRATEAMLDMSTVFGQDLSASAVQLGKALNDPIAGVTALGRVGVTFTEQQKEQIRVMMEANEIAGAQAVVLAELERQVGGSAQALANPITQLGNAWGDLGEAIVGAAAPAMGNLATHLLPHVQGAIERVNGILGSEGFQKTLGEVATAVGEKLGGALTWLMDEGLPRVGGAIGSFKDNVLPGLIEAFNNLKDTVLPPLQTAFDNVRGALDDFRQGLAGQFVAGEGMSDVEILFGSIGNAIGVGRDALITFKDALTGDWKTGDAHPLHEFAGKLGLFVKDTILFVEEHGPAFRGAFLAIGAVLLGASVAGAITTVAGLLVGLLSPMSVIIIVAGLMGAAWATNFGGIRTRTEEASPFIKAALYGITEAAQRIGIGIYGSYLLWDTYLPGFADTAKGTERIIQIAFAGIERSINIATAAIERLILMWEQARIALGKPITPRVNDPNTSSDGSYPDPASAPTGAPGETSMRAGPESLSIQLPSPGYPTGSQYASPYGSNFAMTPQEPPLVVYATLASSYDAATLATDLAYYRRRTRT